MQGEEVNPQQGLGEGPPSWAAGSLLHRPKFPGGPEAPSVGKAPLSEASTGKETEKPRAVVLPNS